MDKKKRKKTNISQTSQHKNLHIEQRQPLIKQWMIPGAQEGSAAYVLLFK